MKSQSINVKSRTETGKGPNTRLRAAGRIPAVVYGTGGENEKVSLDYREFDKMITASGTAGTILNIQYEGAASNATENAAVIREVQRDPVTRRFLHVDLYRINMNVENVFGVPLVMQGTPVGVREGGILESHLRSVEVRCLPAALPSRLVVDISGVRVNQSLHVSDLKLPEGVVAVSDAEEVVCTVLPPKADKTAAAGPEGEAPAQPEVIGKKKTEEAAG